MLCNLEDETTKKNKLAAGIDETELRVKAYDIDALKKILNKFFENQQILDL